MLSSLPGNNDSRLPLNTDSNEQRGRSQARDLFFKRSRSRINTGSKNTSQETSPISIKSLGKAISPLLPRTPFRSKFTSEETNPSIKIIDTTIENKITYKVLAEEFRRAKEMMVESSSTSQSFCPPTPCGLRLSRRYSSNAKRIYMQAEENKTVTIGQQMYKIDDLIGAGTFMQVYSVEGNKKYAVKIYGEGKLAFNDQVISDYMSRSLASYIKARELGLIVAIIYNVETLKEDGCFLVQRIPLDPLDFSSVSHLKQLRKFFKVSWEARVVMDLAYSNLLNNNGVITLVDFLEEDIDFDSKEFKIHTIHVLGSYAQAILTQTKGSGIPQEKKIDLCRKLFTKLTRNLLGLSEKWCEKAIDSTFTMIR